MRRRHDAGTQTSSATFTRQPVHADGEPDGIGHRHRDQRPGRDRLRRRTAPEPYNYGTSVTLTAAAATGSTFNGWSGEGCSGTGTCVVAMTQARNVTATFTTNQFTLTVTRTGTGSGTVTSAPGGISCGTTARALRLQHVGDADRNGGDRFDVLGMERRLHRHLRVRCLDDRGSRHRRNLCRRSGGPDDYDGVASARNDGRGHTGRGDGNQPDRRWHHGDRWWHSRNERVGQRIRSCGS